ncbi:hypothetical protein C0993_008081 [Termitomyces sp. T159_Od127]|nr:hypothetical protein C0993_008081 [Termitomyces sp. T159_Od127]
MAAFLFKLTLFLRVWCSCRTCVCILIKVSNLKAHSTTSIVSLQGTTPLPSHPKTLRDLTHASEILTLPSSFGAIQLGETFSSCLCVNNESQFDVEAVTLRVEMQTATAKVVLAEYGGPDNRLPSGKTFEDVVHHEIKELGQHVTNPLLVKTKVHVPKSPSALLSRVEREKIFLEAHIQNLTQAPMYFEKVKFECVDEWEAEDVNFLDDKDPLFSGPQALMQPQDIRQYLYILKPKTTSLSSPTLPPGTVVPLGRLDIFWRSSFGEPGRLLTSMLSRRIPMPPTMQVPVSALPPYLKRAVAHGSSSRPQSPQPNRSSTPPPRPGSPNPRPNNTNQSRPQSPLQPQVAPRPELEVGLLIRDTPWDTLKVDKPFTLPLTLILSTTRQTENDKSCRIVQIVVQHLQPPSVHVSPTTIPAPGTETFSPRLPSSGFSTPTSTTPNSNYAIAHQHPTVVSPHQRALNALQGNLAVGNNDTPLLPTPYFKGLDEFKPLPTVLYVGSSALRLPPIELSPEPGVAGQTIATQDFELTYLPTRKGFATVGGLRILLVEDKFVDSSGTENTDPGGSLGQARTLKEWDVIAEAWISP